MTPPVRPVRLTVERAGIAALQDLGRPGHADIGVAVNGALDQHAARTANILVGNADDAPLIEVTGSELAFRADREVLIAVTGAVDHVVVQGHSRPSDQTMAVPAASQVIVPVPRSGLRSYVAVNGEIDGARVLGSVAPDPSLGAGRMLRARDEIVVRSAYRLRPDDPYDAVFRLVAPRPRRATVTVDVTPGPDIDRLTLGRAALDGAFEVLPQSDHVGLRLAGSRPLERLTDAEILSRGVPIGAVEAPPDGGLIILLRGRLVTAGYPVVAVVTTESIDRLGQVRPADRILISFCTNEIARDRLHERVAGRAALARVVRDAFSARGLGDILSARHGSPG